MSLKITAKSLDVKARQVIEVPIYTKFLDAHLDVRFNNCLLWWLADDEEGVKTEKAEILMLEHEAELIPQSAKYIGNFKANQGSIFVFVSRNSDNPLTIVPHVFSK